VQSVSAGDTLDRAAYLMWDHDCGAVPVLDGDERLIGVITDRDICMSALFQGAALRDIHVRDVMTSDVRSCRPEDDISEAEHLMRTHQVHRLPVTNEDGTIIGMLSVSDVVRRAKRGIRPTKQTGTEEQCLETLAAIRRPRPHAMTAERVAS
jgi:CBS domain-containing protein